MSAKRFLYVAAGVFLLVAAYSLGAGRAQGQATSNRIVGITAVKTYTANGASVEDVAVAVAENGDWYYQVIYPGPWPSVPWQRGGNIGLGPVSIEGATWSRVKDTYRK